MAQKSHLQIFTIGHGNASADEIVELLHKYDIKELVDVHSAPYSQYNPQFNREIFEKTLQSAGIPYRFAGEHLGGRPTDPTCYKTSQPPTDKLERSDYLKLVDYNEVAKRDFYRKGIERLVQLAHDHRVAIMCSEEDPDHCHRSHLIGHTLADQGIVVRHIRRDGSEEPQKDRLPQQLDLFSAD